MKRILALIICSFCASMLVWSVGRAQSDRSDEKSLAEVQPSNPAQTAKIQWLGMDFEPRTLATAGVQYTGALDEVCIAKQASIILTKVLNDNVPSLLTCRVGSFKVNEIKNNYSTQYIGSLEGQESCTSDDLMKSLIFAEKALALARIKSAEVCEIKKAVPANNTRRYISDEVPEIRRLLELVVSSLQVKIESIERRLTPAEVNQNPAPSRR